MSTSSPSPLQGKSLVVLAARPNAGKGTQAPRLEEAYELPIFDMGATFRAILKEGKDPQLKSELDSFMGQGKLVPVETVVKVFEKNLKALATEKNRKAAEAEKPPVRGFILDGFPRSEAQASALTKLCQEWGARIAKVIYLDVSLDIVKARATGRRFCSKDSSHVYNVDEKITKDAPELKPKHQKMAADGRTPALDAEGRPIWLCNIDQAELIVRPDDELQTVKKRLDEYEEQTNPMIIYFREAGLLAEINGAQHPDKVTEDIKAVLEPILGAPQLSARL